MVKRKRTAFVKDTFREISRTLPRFCSIVAIVAIGVAFYTGVRAASPDMQLTANDYFEERQLFDYRLLSTLGFTQDDVQKISELPLDITVQPGYTADVLLANGQAEWVARLHSLGESENVINIPELQSGEWPQSGECLIDPDLARNSGYAIGDTITLNAGNGESISDILNQNEFVISGIAHSPLYISRERGSSAIGNGSVSGYILLKTEDFAFEAYTEIYITGQSEYSRFESAYDDMLADMKPLLEDLGALRALIREEDIRREAQEKIADARVELEDGKRELAEGKQKLDDAAAEIADGLRKLREEEENYFIKLADGEAKIKESEAELADALAVVNANQRTLDAGEIQINEAEAQLAASRAELDQGAAQAEALLQQLNELNAMIAATPDGPQKQAMQAQAEPLAAGYEQAQLAVTQGELAYSQALAQLQTERERITQGLAQLAEGRKKVDEGFVQLNESRTELTEGKIEGAGELRKAREKLAEAQIEWEDGEKTYQEEKSDAEQKIADGEEEIADAQRKLDEMKAAKWYVLDHHTNIGFESYYQDSQRISAIGQVFPIIFFMVAALVCLTAMTRMVEENRSNIGTMKSLGYRKLDIAQKYLWYALFATLLGSGIGIAVGMQLFPRVIGNAYGILYRLPSIKTPVNIPFAVMATSAAVMSTVLAVVFAVGGELTAPPAILMRPRAPRPGKRILLERIPLLWNRLNFAQKLTMRNLFRYKGRLWMTLIGIAGCTALLFTGFGLRDSISGMMDMQFGPIRQYDAQINLRDEEEYQALEEVLDSEAVVTGRRYLSQSAVEVTFNGLTRDVYLVVPDEQGLEGYITLRTRIGHVPVELSSDGVLMTEKNAARMGVKVGDTVQLVIDDERYDVSVNGIVENYLLHYVYMSSAQYEQLTGKAPEYREMLLQLADTTDEAQQVLSTRLLTQDSVGDIAYTTRQYKSNRDMLDKLIYVIIVLIAAAAALAFVVLFNLNSINIDERERELATIKVLGFYDQEVSQYVYRENILLTLMGALLGLGLGVVMHRFIITTVEVDLIMFSRQVHFVSYLYSFALTIVFALCVNLLMNFKLRRIDMVESLKSAE